MKARGIVALLTAIGMGSALFLWQPTLMKSEEEEPAASAPALQPASPEAGLAPAAENDDLILFFDNRTGGIAVEHKASGHRFYSNPLDAAEDPKASDDIKQKLMSQVELLYRTKGKEGEAEMNSYAHAAQLGQVKWGKLPNGMRVEMTLGREEQRLLLPQRITKESFEMFILEKIESERGKRQAQAYYILDEGTGVYSLKTSLNDRDKRVLEGLVQEAGYTYEMLEAEYEKIGYSGDDAAFPYFKLAVDYALEGNGLTAKLRVGDIEYDTERFELVRLSLLGYFGAGKTGEDGYLFLPDGSGTLMRFNNDGSKTTLLTTGKLYGPDRALTQSPRGSFKQEFRAPVFGIKRGDAALLAVIEEGDATAEINGMAGGIVHSWNTAYAAFTIRNKDTYIAENAFEQAPWIVYEKAGYDGDIALRYVFLAGDDANYVGMAKAYRDTLVDRGVLKPASPEAQVPFYLETMGAVEAMTRKWGFPVVSRMAITSFEEAGTMLEELAARGVGSLKLRYTAWYNGGFFHTAPSNMKTEKALGGAAGLRRLSEQASRAGAQVFPDVDFLYVSDNRWFDGFAPKQDSIRTLFQKIGYNAYLNPAELEYENNEWIVDPRKLPGYYESFSKAYRSLGIDAMSLSTLGEGLHSNFKTNRDSNRQQAQGYQTSVLAKASSEYGAIMTDFGNAYTFPYADHILRLPTEDSSFAVADEAVPFLQIALHGYVGYAGEPLNLTNDVRRAVLKTLETGGGVYFKLNAGDNRELKHANLFNERYASSFDEWKEDAASIYAEVDEALRDVQGEPIVDHERLDEDVYRTTFANGKRIVINYRDEAVSVDGATIGPVDYAVWAP
ncbi:DUF5696 domain-containing protein [Paenibacillus antri]|uniref:DUF5696 domain-containing protein n=1 Tax=Paenibacillus antri TaxID=2582848 RepID=UPI0013052C33|nr:DUF5696 domain-containing protein [Paenibacillus antri]